MNSAQKNILELCDNIWKFRKGSDKKFWLDKEFEDQNNELLIYKQLDGLRSILFLLNQDEISFNEIRFKHELHLEIENFIELFNKKEYFYPSPYSYLVEFQPDNYIDMASHCLVFCLHILKIHSISEKLKTGTLQLIDKCIECLTNRNNFFFDEKEKVSAWAGTTLFNDPKNDFEIKNVYFTALVLLAIGEWIKTPISFNSNLRSENNLLEIKKLINYGCRWILFQRKDNILITNLKKTVISSDELIIINSVGLKACLFNIDFITSQNEKKILEDCCTNFISYLNKEKPKDLTWYHQVLSTKVGMQYYEDRQGITGVVSFLAFADKYFKDKPIQGIEDITEFFINDLLTERYEFELISFYPYYVEDYYYIQTHFNKYFESITTNVKYIKKAIKAVLYDQSILEIFSKLIIKNLTGLNNDEKLDLFKKKFKNNKKVK